jgi:hypothetical protein
VLNGVVPRVVPSAARTRVVPSSLNRVRTRVPGRVDMMKRKRVDTRVPKFRDVVG